MKHLGAHNEVQEWKPNSTNQNLWWAARQQLFLTKSYMTAHWEFAKRCLNGFQTVSVRIHWSDETTTGPHVPSVCAVEPEHHLINSNPTVKCGGGIMMFLSYRDCETAVRVEVERDTTSLSDHLSLRLTQSEASRHENTGRLQGKSLKVTQPESERSRIRHV